MICSSVWIIADEGVFLHFFTSFVFRIPIRDTTVEIFQSFKSFFNNENWDSVLYKFNTWGTAERLKIDAIVYKEIIFRVMTIAFFK